MGVLGECVLFSFPPLKKKKKINKLKIFYSGGFLIFAISRTSDGQNINSTNF